jgi:hypothetical protein
MHGTGDKGFRASYHLSLSHLITFGDQRLIGSTYMLGKRNDHLIRQRSLPERFPDTNIFVIRGMYPPAECEYLHLFFGSEPTSTGIDSGLIYMVIIEISLYI